VYILQNLLKAISDPKWREAMQEEMRALPKNKTWELVQLPSEKKTVGCKWLFTVEHEVDGSNEKI
jgi:hypothetical protein